jgi:hypothetical protein
MKGSHEGVKSALDPYGSKVKAIKSSFKCWIGGFLRFCGASRKLNFNRIGRNFFNSDELKAFKRGQVKLTH